MAEYLACSYTFTPEEFRTTVLLSRRRLAAWRKILYVGMCLVFLVVAGLSSLGLVRPDGTVDYGSLFPLAILLFCSVYLLTRIIPLRAFCSIGNFRKRSYCNRMVQNTISTEGIGSQTEHAAATVLWPGIREAFESAEGFGILLAESKGTFIWFPFHGFASPADIERSRELIRVNVKEFHRI